MNKKELALEVIERLKNEYPDADGLSEIAISSAKSFKQLVGKEPRVAMLSYSTYGSASSPLTEKVIEASRIL